MSITETTITSPKKQLEFYKALSEQLQQENRQLKELYNKALSNDVKTTKILMDLEKWLKEDLGVIYTAESMSGREFTTAKEVAVIDVLKK